MCVPPAWDNGARNGSESDVDCCGVCGSTCEGGQSCHRDEDCGSLDCDNGTCTTTIGSDCTVATAIDLGNTANWFSVTVPTDGCIKVRNYPWGWGETVLYLAALAPESGINAIGPPNRGASLREPVAPGAWRSRREAAGVAGALVRAPGSRATLVPDCTGGGGHWECLILFRFVSVRRKHRAECRLSPGWHLKRCGWIEPPLVRSGDGSPFAMWLSRPFVAVPTDSGR